MISQHLINEFTAVLGNENIVTNASSIREAETTTYLTTESISLILRPQTVGQLQQCIILAQQYKQPVYTISKGKNWGYGSRVPVTDNNVLIELTQLNHILDFDEKQAYITIEPGVSFIDVFTFLRERKSELIISTIGGAGSASIIGNALERGIGTGLYADRFAHVCGMEVLLPDGSLIATGFERYKNSKAGKLFRWGSGPSLDGLFSQSNLGIVTKMTVWLMKTPPQLSLLFYKINDVAKLPYVIDELQSMVMEGLVRTTLTLYNDMRVVSSMMQYPFQQTGNAIIDPDVLMQQIKAMVPLINAAVGNWNGEISIRSANKEHAEMQIHLIKQRLENWVESFTEVHATKEDIMASFQEACLPSGAAVAPPTMQSFLLRKYTGIPDDSAVKQTYWRKRKPAPATDMNPDRDKCGLVWICPVVPFNGEDVVSVVDIIKTVVKKYKFEPAISFQCTSERCINVIASFGWDREVEGEDEMAETCYFEAEEALHQQGYFSYRNTTLAMHKNATEYTEDAYNHFLSGLKKAIDPANILSPYKYIIPSESNT